MKKRNIDLLIYRLLTTLELDTTEYIMLRINGIFIRTDNITTDNSTIKLYWKGSLIVQAYYDDIDSIEKF